MTKLRQNAARAAFLLGEPDKEIMPDSARLADRSTQPTMFGERNLATCGNNPQLSHPVGQTALSPPSQIINDFVRH